MKKDKTVVVGFHNGQNYDFHLFVKSLGKLPGHIRTIAKNSEKYISVEKVICVDEYKYWDEKGNPRIKKDNWNIRFVDRCRFLKGKLEDLVKNLPEKGFKLLEKGIGTIFGFDPEK